MTKKYIRALAGGSGGSTNLLPLEDPCLAPRAALAHEHLDELEALELEA